MMQSYVRGLFKERLVHKVFADFVLMSVALAVAAFGLAGCGNSTETHGQQGISNFVSATGVTVSPTTVTLQAIGDTVQLTATVAPANATNKAIIWSSSNTGVATVDKGKVTAVASGQAVISAITADSSFTATSTVTVNIPVTGVTVSPSVMGLALGDQPTGTFTATVAPAAATNKAVTWSTSDSAVATVDSSGVVTAVAVGNATITATTTDGSFTATGAVTVSAAIIHVTGVTVSPGTLDLVMGAIPTGALTATVAPAEATNTGVSWSSSNTAVATVSSTGVVTAVAAGSATVSATTTDGSFIATSAVTVKNNLLGINFESGGASGFVQAYSGGILPITTDTSTNATNVLTYTSAGNYEAYTRTLTSPLNLSGGATLQVDVNNPASPKGVVVFIQDGAGKRAYQWIPGTGAWETAKKITITASGYLGGWTDSTAPDLTNITAIGFNANEHSETGYIDNIYIY